MFPFIKWPCGRPPESTTLLIRGQRLMRAARQLSPAVRWVTFAVMGGTISPKGVVGLSWGSPSGLLIASEVFRGTGQPVALPAYDFLFDGRTVAQAKSNNSAKDAFNWPSVIIYRNREMCMPEHSVTGRIIQFCVTAGACNYALDCSPIDANNYLNPYVSLLSPPPCPRWIVAARRNKRRSTCSMRWFRCRCSVLWLGQNCCRCQKQGERKDISISHARPIYCHTQIVASDGR